MTGGSAALQESGHDWRLRDPDAPSHDVAKAVVPYRGQSRLHTGSDLKIFLTWCAGQGLDPLHVGRADIERYVRWLQETRFYQPSTVSRRLSVVTASTGCASSTRSCRTPRPT